MSPDTTDDEFTVKIWTKADAKGQFHVHMSWPGTDLTLTSDLAHSWCQYVLAAVAAAEYDEAVMRQFTHLAPETTHGKINLGGYTLIRQLRADRGEQYHDPLISDFSLTPAVSGTTLAGFLQVHHKKVRIGQWTLNDARQHALSLLESMATAPLDSAYLRLLTTTMRLPEAHARNVVNDLADFRPQNSPFRDVEEGATEE